MPPFPQLTKYFGVHDNDVLDHLHNELVKLIEILKYHAPKDESLILEKPNVSET